MASVSECGCRHVTVYGSRVTAVLRAQVLNVGSNKLSGQLRIKGVPKLRALIANGNDITAVKGGWLSEVFQGQR